MTSASNIYFNNLESSAEQKLVEDLIIESISIYGHSIYYCPRTITAKDEIYGEDTLSTYDKAYLFDVYIKSYDSYEGDGTFLSKFNLEIRDQVTFVIARRTYLTNIGDTEGEVRPLEGDLIYSQMMKRLFVVKYVQMQPTFYQFGALQTYEVVCEMFEYSNERLNTGIEEIDALETQYSFANAASNAVFSDALSDVFETNLEFQDKANNIIDWSETDPFSSGQF